MSLVLSWASPCSSSSTSPRTATTGTSSRAEPAAPPARRPGHAGPRGVRRESGRQVGSAVPSSPANPGSGMRRSVEPPAITRPLIAILAPTGRPPPCDRLDRVDEVTWAALTAVLTALGAAWTWYAFRQPGRRLRAAGRRAHAAARRPLPDRDARDVHRDRRLGRRLGDHLVLNPVVWAGIVLAGLSVVLLGSSAVLRERRRPAARAAARARAGAERRAAAPAHEARAAVDDDLADIEAILKRRGIT